MILVPFAKLGAPYELSLSIISLIFSGTAISLIIWKAPFPRIIRLLLPFTYFFFYQYGVIARPYCVMMLVFVLLALNWHRRNTHPGIYTVLLMLLCLTSAYGIVIAGGLAIAWIIEIWNFQNIREFARNLMKNKKLLFLLMLLLFALLLIMEIMPREDTFATNHMSRSMGSNFVNYLLYMLLALPAEVSMTSIYVEYQLLKNVELPFSILMPTCLIGCIFWGVVICWGKTKQTLWTLIIPYLFFALFSAIVYIYPHHIGIALFVFMFWFWINCKVKTNLPRPSSLLASPKTTITNVLTILGSMAVVISLCWNVSSCVQDVLSGYAIGRNEAAFIKKHGLDNYRIMVGWEVFYDEEEENIIGMDINHCICADNVAPYFEHNIFFNFNNGEDSLNFSNHKSASEEYTASCLAQWKEQPPDVLFMSPRLDLVYDNTKLILDNYKLVYLESYNRVWKGFPNYSRARIYVKSKLAEILGLEEIYN